MITLTGLRDEADDDSNEQVMVIMGRFIDGEYLAWLEQITGSRIQLSSIQSEHEQSFNGLVEVLTSQALVHSTGQNIWLQVGRSFDWKPRLLQLFFILLAIVSVLTLGSWAVQRSLRHLVVSRIEKFSALARTSDAGDNIMYWPNEGKTELDDLAGAFNNVVKRLNNSKLNLQHQAETDYLTGLNNRHALETRLNQMVGESCKPSLLLMDLDGFKLINDSLGHAAGDYLLQQVALRLCDSMRHNDAIFRIGGDEFVAIFPHTDTSLASALAKRLLQSLEEPILYQDHTLKVSASIGIAQWQDNISGSELMRFADLAMYAAKHDGKARIRCFEEKMNIGIREQFCFEQAFRKALAERRIEAWFQPILDTQTNVIIAVELLARWQHQGQMIAPLTFIRLAEELGLIANLSELLLEQGLTELAQLRRQIPELKLHINISALQFTDHMLAHKILAHIRKHQLPSSAIVIELTETALLRYPEQVDDILKVFDNAHVCMQLDNFGTGYSSISHLNSLPFDAIKLDRSFVEKLNHADTSLTKAIYDLAHNLGLNLVAEGVENNIEYTSLKEIGYQHMQGYLFAKPMDIDKLHPWISAYLQPNNTELTSTKTSFSSTKPSAPLQTS